jgi:hypothetical protein
MRDTAETLRTLSRAEKAKSLGLELLPFTQILALLCAPLRPLRLCGVFHVVWFAVEP